MNYTVKELHQRVGDDDMNIICFGSKVVDHVLTWKLITIFINSIFNNAERHVRRWQKSEAFESDFKEGIKYGWKIKRAIKPV